ncbi:MAG TPA: hypothetical protein VH188_00320 [Chthoniobacterales bacterium]|jgi:hypothetical protein|nr:hypothetical protein [Chthoniobacterales bacterium]
MKGVSVVVVAALALLCGCNRDDQQIKVYKVAKAPLETTPAPEAAMPTNASSPSVLSSNGPGLTTTATAEAPKNWESQPLSQMREASFIVRGENGATADISLVRLGPAAGNILDNVNRWLGQLKQPAVTEEKLRSMIQPLGDSAVVDLSGQPENGDPAKDGRIIGAIASDENGTAFYKMRGNAELVGAEKENFLKWVSASRGGTSTSVTTDTTTPGAPSDAETPQIKWEVPAGWSSTPPSVMRYASFSAEENGAKADISVVTFPGDGGSDVDNVNRWRQQIGLPIVGAELLKPMIAAVHSGDVHIDTIDMAGPSARVIAGWTRHGGHAWFFKMTGPPQLIEEQKPKFMAFLQSIRF